MSYYDQGNADLKVVRCDDAACAPPGFIITALDSSGDVGKYSSIVLGMATRS